MTTPAYARRMAAYNQWMNGKVYAATARLPVDERSRDRGAFFRSIIGTLNHLVVADTLWLQRFSRHDSRPEALGALLDLPTPGRLDEIVFDDLSALQGRRTFLDAAIVGWAGGLDERQLASSLQFRSTKGVPFERPVDELLVHFFNHQTHHRGQVTALLTQAGEDVGVTDLLAMPPHDG